MNYLIHNSLDDCHAFDRLLESIWKEGDGTIKFPWQPGTSAYIACIPHPDNTGQYACLIDGRVDTLALSDPTVAAAASNQKTFSEIKALGWFPDLNREV